MKLISGKRYITRDNVVTGPVYTRDNEKWPFYANVYGIDVSYSDNGFYHDENHPNTADLIAEFIGDELSFNNLSIRAQRRYEIAKDCLAALIHTDSTLDGCYVPELVTKRAVNIADVLLAELEKSQ